MTVRLFRAALRAVLFAAAAWSGGIAVAQTISTEPQLRIEAGMHTAALNRISTDAQGRWVATASDDKTARVWDASTGRLVQVIRPPAREGNEGKLYAVAMSPDGRFVAVGGWTKLGSEKGHTVYVFERSSGRMLRLLKGLGDVVLHMAFSPDGRWLAVTLASGYGVRVWEAGVSGGQILRDTDYADASYGAAFTRDGRYLVTGADDGKLRLYELDGGTLRKVAEQPTGGTGSQPSSISVHPAGDRVAVGYSDTTRVDVFALPSLAHLFSPNNDQVNYGSLGAVSWSQDGRELAAGGRWVSSGRHPVRIWSDAGRGAYRDVPSSRNTVMQIAPVNGGGFLVAGISPEWGTIDTQGRWNARTVSPKADLRGSVRENFLVGAGGTQVQFGFELNGKPAHVFDLRRRALREGTLAGGAQADTTGLPVTNWEDRRDPAVAGHPLKLLPGETARSVVVLPDRSGLLLGGWKLRLFDRDGKLQAERASTETAWGLNIPRDGPQAGRVVVVAYGDGTIRWHRLPDLQELLAFYPHGDRKRWVMWTPQGYYDASPGGEDLIGWHVNRAGDEAADFFAASQFRTRFWRPDVIDRVLDTLDEGEALKQADAVRGRPVTPTSPVTIAQTLPPVLEWLAEAPAQSADSQVKLRVRARVAADAPVTQWRVRVNGQVIGDARGLARTDAPPATAPGQGAPAGTLEREFEIPLKSADNEIQVFAENRHGTSQPLAAQVKWVGAPAGNSFQIQPKLYVLAVGVGQYQNPEISKLQLPAKDARDLAAALQRQKGRLYREVEVKVLTDQQATADSVVDGLEWLQRAVTQHDVGIVFLSGHGVNDPVQGYTYLPVNADPQRLRRTGVPMDEFKKTLASLTGKALFFFDTCHSGNVLGTAKGAPNDVSGVINELAKSENGVIVFSSSTGRQLSYEDVSWGNGAFTKALVEGLDGKADFRKDGRITHKMLDLYVSERVKELTKGRQSPVTQAPGGVPDYPIAVLR